MKTSEQYLAQILKAMRDFQHTEFKSIEEQDAALTALLSMREEMLANMDNTCVTTPNYWECDCKDNYLNSSQTGYCHECQSDSDKCPDARISDVVRALESGREIM